MRCIAVSIDEVMAWVDAFCASTGLAPSHAALLYAEFCFTADFEGLVAQVLVRSFSMADLDDSSYEHEVQQIMAQSFEQSSEAEKEMIHEHFYRVLHHHGFKAGAIATLFMHLNPHSMYENRAVEINRVFLYQDEFVKEPFFEQFTAAV